MAVQTGQNQTLDLQIPSGNFPTRRNSPITTIQNQEQEKPYLPASLNSIQNVYQTEPTPIKINPKSLALPGTYTNKTGGERFSGKIEDTNLINPTTLTEQYTQKLNQDSSTLEADVANTSRRIQEDRYKNLVNGVKSNAYHTPLKFNAPETLYTKQLRLPTQKIDNQGLAQIVAEQTRKNGGSTYNSQIHGKIQPYANNGVKKTGTNYNSQGAGMNQFMAMIQQVLGEQTSLNYNNSGIEAILAQIGIQNTGNGKQMNNNGNNYRTPTKQMINFDSKTGNEGYAGMNVMSGAGYLAAISQQKIVSVNPNGFFMAEQTKAVIVSTGNNKSTQAYSSSKK